MFELPNDFTEGPDDPVSIRTYNSDKSAFNNRVTLHQHLFSFLLEGQKSVSYAQKSDTIDASNCLLLLAGNCLMSEKLASENGNYRSILFFFDVGVLTDLFLKYGHLRGAGRKSAEPQEPFIVFQKDPFIQNFLASLELMLSSGEISPAMRQLKLEELMLYLAEKQPVLIENLHRSVRTTDEELEIRLTVEKNIESPMTVEEMAFLCNTSLSTFKRRFTRIYGSSPSRWMLLKRMETAAGLLEKGNRKPSEIYHQVGYENLSSFIQSFKQVYGVTPGEFQNARLNA
jgi:AraC-like DNA-binding protein